jgi:hypothetical protein
MIGFLQRVKYLQIHTLKCEELLLVLWQKTFGINRLDETSGYQRYNGDFRAEL